MKRVPPFPQEVRERAVRLVLDHQGEPASQHAAMRSIAAKIGCSREILHHWVRQAARDLGAGAARGSSLRRSRGCLGLRAGPTTDKRERLRAPEREVCELRQANEILRKASAYFAMAELDRRSRTR